jgi:hypothetical protein
MSPSNIYKKKMSDPHYSNFKLKMKICALKIILICLNKIYILAFKSWVKNTVIIYRIMAAMNVETDIITSIIACYEG